MKARSTHSPFSTQATQATQVRPTTHAAQAMFASAACTLWALFGCSSETKPPPTEAAYALVSIVIDADGNRTTYVQTIASLDSGPFDNTRAIELPGNGTVISGGRHFYVGLAEEPTWVRYSLSDSGTIEETGRLSFLNLGAMAIDYGNTLVDEETAVSVLSQQALAVIWNPSTMEIRAELPLPHLVQEGYSLEVWTTIAHHGLVYVPGRWADWEGGRIRDGVTMTIIDPQGPSIVGVAEDGRCASGGRIVFDEAGYGYVMGDGRNYSIQMFANASGGTAPDNCLLRIPPGGTDFEEDYYYAIPPLSGGRQSITELETSRQGSGVGFSKMFYPDHLPEGVQPIDFGFWSVPSHKMWRIDLGDPPVAREVDNIPFSTIGFEGSPLDGRLYSGESPDGMKSEVYEIDPDTNSARFRFEMDGYFDGLFALTR